MKQVAYAGRFESIMEKRFVTLIAVWVVAGCSTSWGHGMTDGQGTMLQYPSRSLDDWQPARAVEEAKTDIAAGRPKIYIAGTRVPSAVGIDPKYHDLIRPLPQADAGIGCLVRDSALRDAQFEYARQYNECVLQYLLSK
jgi:hypothetical protein